MKSLECVTIVGVGLIGGSIGLALRSRAANVRVVGCGSRPATLQQALQVGALSEVETDLARAVRDADLVVVCAPVGHIVAEVRKLAPLCRPGTLITDAGSTKVDIVAGLQSASAHDLTWPAEVRFIGSHPLAGNEKKGPQHSRAELFEGRTVVVTPTDQTRAEDCQRIVDFWTLLGARVVPMSAEDHDYALAATSHLPHLAASAIAASTPEQYLTLTASGWQDTTRIAAGDPELWRQIMLGNRANLLESLDRLTALLAQWRTALVAEDGAELQRLLTEAKRIRDAVGS